MSTNKKPKVFDDSLFCTQCLQEFNSSESLRNHRYESHDGPERRLNPLECQSCGSSFQSRTGLKRHILKCPKVQDITFPRSCPWCLTADNNVVSEDLIEWAKHSRNCMSWPTVAESKQEQDDWISFETSLLSNTKHHASADLVKKMFVPVTIKLPEDKKTFGFILESGAHLLQENGNLAIVSPLIRQSEQTKEDVELSLALSPHKYGKLVDLNQYDHARDDDDFWSLPFKGSSPFIARRLQSCLIQSGTEVIFCIKVEVYGRSQAEDPQADADVALPVGARSFNVVNLSFKETSQLMIGGVRWNVLVTLAVILTSGRVIVGPHNPLFKPHRNSHLWLKKGAEKDMHNNLFRQTRSNFDNIATYGLHAAIAPRFNQYLTRPVTLSDLWSFKVSKNSWSGIKLAAFIFYTLYEGREPLLKADVQEHLKLIRREKVNRTEDGESDNGIRNNLVRFVLAMKDKETKPVSRALDKELKCLAENAQNELTKINNSNVTFHVHATIFSVLDDA